MRIEDVEACRQVLVRRAVLAEGACAGGVGVGEITARAIDEWLHELSASLSGWRGDCLQLHRRAIDVVVADGLPKNTFDEVGVWRNPIHPLPPPELPEGLKNTITRAKDQQSQIIRRESSTYNVMTKEKRKLNNSAAISVLGAMAATAWPIVV